ncbi:MAG: RNA-binding S4 domain-containing protein [Rikenellaceae bacterium]
MGVRIDKWLWAMRLYKTRSIATDACKNNRVSINGSPAKPSREVVVGDVIAVRKPPVTYTHKIKELITNRQPAKEVSRYMQDMTPDAEKEKLQQRLTIFMSRDRGTGRPTKKERRDLDDLMEEFEEYETFED